MYLTEVIASLKETLLTRRTAGVSGELESTPFFCNGMSNPLSPLFLKPNMLDGMDEVENLLILPALLGKDQLSDALSVEPSLLLPHLLMFCRKPFFLFLVFSPLEELVVVELLISSLSAEDIPEDKLSDRKSDLLQTFGFIFFGDGLQWSPSSNLRQVLSHR